MTDTTTSTTDDATTTTNTSISNDAAPLSPSSPPASTTEEEETSYQDQITKLKELVALKDRQMNDLQRGLEAQVHMVMELEKLEQKELRDYDSKLEANKRLIGELGDRVGQESKLRAEKESQLHFMEQKCLDQESRIARLEDMNNVNSQLVKELQSKAQRAYSNGNGTHSNVTHQSGPDTKLQFMIETNNKLVMQLAQGQEDLQKARQDISDKELLCLELSSQLDKLATQLNGADEDMAAVRAEVASREKALHNAEERVQMLEKSIMEAPENDDKQGRALLLRKLKDKEAQCEKWQQERDASLAKATKLSLALASSREHVDALQEKLDYQNSIVDRILGKRNGISNSSTHNTNTANPTLQTPRRHSSKERGGVRRSLSATGSALMSRAQSTGSTNNNHHNTPSANTSQMSLNSTGSSTKSQPFDGRRIRNFFNRGRTNSGGGAATTPTPNTGGGAGVNSPPPAATTSSTSKARAPPTTRGLFHRKSFGDNSQSSSNPDPYFDNDDNDNAMFTNQSIGKEDRVEEDCQGGGGAVNLALTL